MIHDFDAEDAARFREPFRRAEVGIRWRRIAARMIMHEHDAIRRTDDRRAEHLAWMRHRFVERTDGDEVMAADPLAHIQHEHRETFAVRVEVRGRRDVLPPVSHGIIRLRVTGKFVGGGFPQRDDLPLVRAFRQALWILRPRRQIEVAHWLARSS